MILIEDIVSITPRDVGLGYYIVLKDGNKIKVTRKRDVFPLLLLIHYQKCNHLEITDELKKEVSDKLGHIKDISKNDHDRLFVRKKYVNITPEFDENRILNKQGKLCNICKTPLSSSYYVDYRIPRSRGGSNEEDNIQLLCKACYLNKRKKCMPCVCECNKDCKLAYPEHSSIIRVLEQK